MGNCTILTAESTADLGIEPVGENTVRLDPERMKLIYPATLFMGAAMALMEEAITIYGGPVGVISRTTTVSLQGETHYPHTKIEFLDVHPSAELRHLLAMLSLRFAEIVCGIQTEDHFRKISLSSEMQLLANTHAERFLMIHGNKRVLSAFVLRASFLDSYDIQITGKYAELPYNLIHKKISGTVDIAGFSKAKNTISLFTDGKVLEMNNSKPELYDTVAYAQIKKCPVKFNGLEISSPKNKKVYSLTCLELASNSDIADSVHAGPLFAFG